MPPDAPKAVIVREEIPEEVKETSEEWEKRWWEIIELQEVYKNKYSDFLWAL